MSSKEANVLHSQLPPPLQKAVDLAQEKGASIWLTALPLKDHGFALHRAAFHDAMALRYGWPPSNLPSKCDCSNNNSIDNALSCAKGGFPSIRHNEICDLTANLLAEVCSEVCIKPHLQPTTPDQLSGATTNSQDGARLDVSANGVWGGRFQKTYFDVQVFTSHAPSNKNQSHSACYRKHEREKKRAYDQRICEVEHSSFSPLVFSATGGMGREATCFYKCLASMLAHKWDQPYGITLWWLRCHLKFSHLLSHPSPTWSKIVTRSCCTLRSIPVLHLTHCYFICLLFLHICHYNFFFIGCISSYHYETLSHDSYAVKASKVIHVH